MLSAQRAGMVFATSRPHQSLLLFWLTSVGIWLQSQDFLIACLLALPSLPILLAGFCLNDYFDAETDRTNHPDRSLAKHPSLKKCVLIYYFTLFLITICMLFFPIYSETRYSWILFFLIMGNYYVTKAALPFFKNLYMAIAGTCALYVIDISGDGSLSNLYFYLPFFIAFLGREISYDIPDIKGDPRTLAKLMGAAGAKTISLSLMSLGSASSILLYMEAQRYAIGGTLLALILIHIYLTSARRWSPAKTQIVSVGVMASLAGFITHL